ncbi:MAG TPA: phytoene desaturase [Bacteroidetes bacterium]|jgi:phytoene desaturase|nr:phytoene desaturase [Bacteroidota bacterium]
MSHIAIIGSGFSGLSAAAYLAKEGYDVVVYEKNALIGGRARQFETDNGYTFDMGPSWYWMPDVFESFFGDFGYSVADLYKLHLLNPSFDIVFGKDDKMSVPENYDELCALFESIEPGSSIKLDKFMAEAAYKYNVGMGDVIYQPGDSITELLLPELIRGVFRLQVFSSFSKHVRSYFSHPKLIALMEFPVLFLGAMPQDTPALYSLMNYAGLKMGTWYPENGFASVTSAMQKVAEEYGATFHTNTNIEKINITGNKASSILVNGEMIYVDVVLASADYHHVETKLLDAKYRNYTEDYWSKKTFAPSSLIFYIGLNKRLDNISHHTLFFDEDITQHAIEIYKKPMWPNKPLFYVCCPSKTDNDVAPIGHENLFLLMPVAPDLEDTEEIREKYFHLMISRMEQQFNVEILSHIDYMQGYCVKDFISDYNSYKGNAYGLANTLMQTAILKPKMRNKKVKNLFYTGQLTVPGPGVPPSLISGKIASKIIISHLDSSK